MWLSDYSCYMLSVRHAARRGRSAKVSIPFHESAHWWGNKLNGRRQHSKLPDMWVYRMKKKKKKKKSCRYCDVVGSNTRNVTITNTHDPTTFESVIFLFFSFRFFSEGPLTNCTSDTKTAGDSLTWTRSCHESAPITPAGGGGAKFYARLFVVVVVDLFPDAQRSSLRGEGGKSFSRRVSSSR